MNIQTQCIRCECVFWSKAFVNKNKEVIAIRNLCRKCENNLRHAQQTQRNIEIANNNGNAYKPIIRVIEERRRKYGGRKVEPHRRKPIPKGT